MDFAALPATVERLLAGTPGGLPDAALPAGPAPERVAIVLLDAFGMRFVQRHAEHPLLRRIARDGVLTPLPSQFPSTTAAHVTTLHTGRPVGEHGLYEWRVYEPALDEVILPLPFARVGEPPDSLHDAGLDPRALLEDRPSLYERLGAHGVDTVAIEPASFCPSTYDRVAARGARLRPYTTFAEGVAALREELIASGPPRFVLLYWDRIDLAGHLEGPDSPAFETACESALDALEIGLRNLGGALVLVSADHGQVATSPDRLDYLDDLWPELLGHLTHAPAGSARDCFLHVDDPPLVRDALATRIDGEVHLVEDLVAAGWFGEAGPRLLARLADVCVLPGPRRQAWVRAHASVEQRFRGQHGGVHPDERDTWVGALYS